MKIALFLNPVKNGIFEYAEKVIKKLKNFDKNVCVYRIQNSFYENVCLDQDADEFIKKCDVIFKASFRNKFWQTWLYYRN